jgi:trans-aconitate methyltransferase
VRGASTSFEPGRYFGNVDADRAKWEGLFARLGRQGRRVRSALDVGCGTGGFLAFLAERLPDARRDGIELDARRAAQARERDPAARIHTGDALEVLDGLEGSFDLVTLWDVFEHIQAPVRLLGALGQVLAPGGEAASPPETLARRLKLSLRLPRTPSGGGVPGFRRAVGGPEPRDLRLGGAPLRSGPARQG